MENPEFLKIKTLRSHHYGRILPCKIQSDPVVSHNRAATTVRGLLN